MLFTTELLGNCSSTGKIINSKIGGSTTAAHAFCTLDCLKVLQWQSAPSLQGVFPRAHMEAFCLGGRGTCIIIIIIIIISSSSSCSSCNDTVIYWYVFPLQQREDRLR